MISRLRRRRARILSERLEAYSARWRCYYDLAVKSGRGMFADGRPCPSFPEEWVDFDPATGRRKRRVQRALGLTVALRIGQVHGWTEAAIAAGPNPVEIDEGLDLLEAYANRGAKR